MIGFIESIVLFIGTSSSSSSSFAAAAAADSTGSFFSCINQQESRFISRFEWGVLQGWIRQGIIHTTQRSISYIIQGTIGNIQGSNEGPNIGIVPFQDGIYSNKFRPAIICLNESL